MDSKLSSSSLPQEDNECVIVSPGEESPDEFRARFLKWYYDNNEENDKKE